ASWTWDGAAFVPCTTLPLSDRGFRYGMSLFESIRVARGQPLFLREHLQRLHQACFRRHIAVDARALEAVARLLRGSALDGLARVYVTAGDGSVTSPAAHPRIYVFAESRPAPDQQPYEIGVTEETFHALFGGLKTGNYWPNLSALENAYARGFNEALLFNERAELVSACMANVFLVHGGAVRTPALECGARNGVMRELVLKHLPVRQGSLFVQDVTSAEEIFLTSSWIGIRSVALVSGRPLSSRKVAESLALVLDQLGIVGD
ncbi:MAG TPA: aminotransferase class IV, partial [Chthoniobacteraceae bacterium]